MSDSADGHMDPSTALRVLGLPADCADWAAVKLAYKACLLRAHPDTQQAATRDHRTPSAPAHCPAATIAALRRARCVLQRLYGDGDGGGGREAILGTFEEGPWSAKLRGGGGGGFVSSRQEKENGEAEARRKAGAAPALAALRAELAALEEAPVREQMRRGPKARAAPLFHSPAHVI